MIYLLHDDPMGEERLAELRAGLGSPDLQSLNTTILDGQRLTLAELRGAAESLPFLGERRLVIVRRLFGSTSRSDGAGDGTTSRKGSRSENDRDKDFLSYFSSIPPTTDLVLIEDSGFSPDNAAAKAIARLGGEVVLGAMPRWDQLTRWIEQRVRQKEGKIDHAASQELSALPVADLRQLDLTLDRLITYADGATIGVADVRSLVPQSREVGVFDLVDAVGARDRRGALAAYRGLLRDGVSPIYLLVMLTRQIRLLLLTHEALGRREDVAAFAKVHPRVAQKLTQQARSFGAERCVAAFELLASVDQQIKTGEADEQIAVELLLITLTEK